MGNKALFAQNNCLRFKKMGDSFAGIKPSPVQGVIFQFSVRGRRVDLSRSLLKIRYVRYHSISKPYFPLLRRVMISKKSSEAPVRVMSGIVAETTSPVFSKLAAGAEAGSGSGGAGI